MQLPWYQKTHIVTEVREEQKKNKMNIKWNTDISNEKLPQFNSFFMLNSVRIMKEVRAQSVQAAENLFNKDQNVMNICKHISTYTRGME